MKINEWLEIINAARVPSLQDIKIKHKQIVLNFYSEYKPKIISKLHYYQNEYGDIVGLNIAALDPKTHEEFIEVWKANYSLFSEKLEALYMYDNVDILELKNFPKLTYLNVSQSPELTSLHIDNAPKLKEIHASLCPKLREVKLGAELNELEKLDISKSPVETFETAKKLRKLAYFIAFETKFKQLNLAHMSQIKYLIAQKSEISEIDWKTVKSLPNIESIELPNTYTSKDETIDITIQKEKGDLLRKELNVYLEQYSKEETIVQHRLKILLLGNTTSGKSSLRRILFSNKDKEVESAKKDEGSTHGANIKTKKLTLGKNKDCYVQIFDFGGQDYYHATHLPFYQAQTWHLLIYGPDQDTNSASDNKYPSSAYHYGIKKVEYRDEVLFPITYWLHSIEQNGREKEDVSAENQNLPKINFIQNLKTDQKSSWELDRWNLIQKKSLEIGEFKEYNFHENAKELKEWLYGYIQENRQERIILKNTLEFQKKISKEVTVLTVKEILDKEYKINNKVLEKAEILSYLNQLHKNHLGYFFCSQENPNDSFFIHDLTQFSQWIHQILSKELISGNGQHGYFNEEEARKRLRTKEAKGHIDKIISFLEKEHVIFPVQGEENKWIAPSYLPAPKSQVEQLLLESFDEPDVKFFLPDFFHTNLIHILIKEFKDSLVQDPEKKTYLLWKNKILLYEDKRNKDSKQKAFLLLELIYPMDAEYSKYKIENAAIKCPVLVIRRNQSGFLPESKFAQVFQFIQTHFNKKITTDIWLRSRLGDYIPFSCINKEIKNTHSERVHSVYYNETLYPTRDFQYFLSGEYQLPTKIFLGYSKENVALVEEFILHLLPYKTQGKIAFFYDKEIKMGDKWDEAIKKQFEECSVFVCFVSPHLLNTSYVTHLELPLAVEKEMKIIPLILEECDWTSLPIRDGNKHLLEDLGVHNAKDKGIPISSNRAVRQAKWKEIAFNLKELKIEKSND